MLYKYRTSQQLQFTLDILLRSRLFAAPYSDLNDPMEGLWHFGDTGPVWPDDIRYIEDRLEKYRVVSLSRNPISTMMWSYYADSHRGLVVGVEVPEQEDAFLVDVNYSSNYIISHDATDAGLDVLAKKSNAWKYEQEVRVLTTHKFINVVPREIFFGIRADEEFISLVEQIANTFCPAARVYRLQLNDLDTYVEPPQTTEADASGA